MTLQMWIVLAILAAAIVLFVTEWLRVDVAALVVVAALMVTGLLTPEAAVSGFSNPAVLTIAALFVVGEAILQTGLAARLGQRLLVLAGASQTRLLLVLMSAVAFMSSFISSTGTVAVLLPVVMMLSRSSGIPPSKLMIPLAYAALLGGSLTLIGTPSNLVVSEMLAQAGRPPFSFFSFTPIGLVLVGLGTAFMVTVGHRLLPARRTRVEQQEVETPQELIDRYRLPDNLFRVRVRRSSDLAGMTMAAASLRPEFRINVLDIERPKARGFTDLAGRGGAEAHTTFVPDAGTVIEAGDILVVQGEGNDIGRAAAHWNLGVQPAAETPTESIINEEAGIAEVILRSRSQLVGQTLVETRFGTRYGLTVLGVYRPGAGGKVSLKETALRAGDVLLVQGPWKNFLALKELRRDFVVIGQPEDMTSVPRDEKATTAVVVVGVMLLVMIAGWLPITTAALLAALALVLTGCLSIDEAYQCIDWRSLVLIAGMLPMAIALEQVGLVQLAAGLLTQVLGQLGPAMILASLFLVTSLFTQVLSNTATTVLVAPVALAAAQALGARPEAFLMAVAIAASMAFMTPVASPVNTLVMGAGGYHFRDYARAGLPMTLIALVVSVAMLLVLFPF